MSYLFHELDLLDQLESTKGTNAKKSLLESSLQFERFVTLIERSLNFFRKYYISQFDMPAPHNLSIDRHDAFLQMLDQLSQRVVTGDAAKLLVTNFFSTCNEQQQKWYSRVLTKHLNVGVSASTAISCKYPIPKFDVMLAKDGYETKNVETIISKGAYASRKLDGYRCIAIYDGTKVMLMSRNGTVFDNFPHIEEEIHARLSANDIKSAVLDGEIMSDDFQAMQRSAFASQRGTVVGDVKYHIFTTIDYEEWLSDSFTETAEERDRNLQHLFAVAFKDSPCIMRVEQIPVNDINDVYDLEERFTDDGYEGVMVIPRDCTYYRGRKSNKLMKFKRVISDVEQLQTMDVTVIGCYEGKRKNKGKLGGLNIIQEDGVTLCKVGSGFNDDERQTIWDDQTLVVGRVCEVKYQNLTNDGKMRFPIFLRWRDNGPGTGKR